MRHSLYDDAGATAVEFAMVAAIFIMIVLVIIDLGRVFWSKATLQSVAEEVARCYAVQKPQNDATLTCATNANAVAYAQTLSNQRGITLSDSTNINLYDALVTAEKATADTNCGATTTMVYVTLRLHYQPILPFEMMSYDVQGKACFPIG